MAQVVKARIWLYTRDVDLPGSLSSGTQGASTGAPKALKHWAIVLDFMSTRNPDRVNNRILYEANNEGGLLVARAVAHGNDQEEEWKEKSGFGMSAQGFASINEARAKSYCDDFNQRKVKYAATTDNCQTFVEMFLANVLPDSAICLPPSAKEYKKSFFESASSTCMKSMSNVGCAAYVKDYWLATIKSSTLNDLAIEAVKKINLNGFGTINLLTEGPVKRYMEQEGVTLVLTTLGEGLENCLNASRGAFCWWNLLQIPVELMVGKMMKETGFTELQAYAGKKVASCLTAVGVGLLATGPAGALASLAFWIATEFLVTAIKCLFASLPVVGDWFTNMFGKSETLELIKSIYRFFQIRFNAGLDTSLEFMLSYIKSTQNTQKKLA